MTTSEIIKQVRRVEIKTKRLSNHIFSGEYHSSFKGKGMSFSEVRRYEMGDDVRDIDWNVTAKLHEPYVKVFEEERELTMMLLVDVSASSTFGTLKSEKRQLMTELCAVLAFSAIQNNDKVGLILFSSEVEKFIPPKKGKSHILRIIRELIEFEPKSKDTNISVALKFMMQVIKKQCITFLVSDFIDEDYQTEIQMASRKYDFTGVRIFDRHEEQMPDVGLIECVDVETNESILIDSSSKKVRTAYDAKFHVHKGYCADVFRKSGSDLIELQTDENYIKKLLAFFKKRS
ncbi:MAG: DUF58 domain-containing protein [Flavobacteriales bacterium]